MTVFTWDAGDGSSTADWTGPTNWDQDSSYPQAGDTAIFPAGKHKCYVNAASECATLTVNGDTADTVIELQNTLLITGDLLITDGIMNTAGYDLTVSGTTDIYGTLTPGDSTCYFGYGGAGSVSDWDFGVRGTGVLNAGTGDWYCGGTGFYSGADVSLTSGVMYISGTAFGYLWSPDQGVASFDNRDGTVILQSDGEVRTMGSANPLTAADNAICPFHTLIVSGGTDRTDAPVITLKRGLKIDNDLIIKNGVLKWNTYAGSYGDVYVVASGTHLIGAASQSAAIVMDDIPQRSGFYTATGTTDVGNGGLYMQGNAIVSGSTANIHSNSLYLSTDYGGSNSSPNKTITGLNGTPYFTFPAGEACAVFDGTDDYILPDDAAVPTGDDPFSIAFWMKPTGDAGTPIWWGTKDTGQGMVLYWSNSSEKVRIGYWGGDLLTGSVSAPADSWSHIVFTYEGGASGDIKAYVNGSAAGTAANTFGVVAGYLSFGGVWDNSSLAQDFTGRLADIRIYDTELTSGEVTTLSATNGATAADGVYAATGSGLVGWWKLQPYQIVDGTGSGEMDFSDSSTNSNTGVNNGTVPGWGGLNLYAKDGNSNTLHTYQRNYLSNNTLPLGVEGRGSTVYIRPTVSNMSFYVSDGDIKSAVTQYTDGRAFKFNNMNILEKTAGDGEVRFKTETYGCGLFDFTGDLFIASGATATVYAQSLAVNRAATPVGDIYVSGNLLIYGTFDDNDSTMVDDFGLGYIPRMPQLLVGALTLANQGVYEATPYLTILSGNVGSKNVEGYDWSPFHLYHWTGSDGTYSFRHNDGTFINKSSKGYIGYAKSGYLGPFYDFIQDTSTNSGQHTQNTSLQIDRDFYLSGTAGEGSYGVWGLRNESAYTTNVSGSMILKDGGSIGFPVLDYDNRIYIGNNLEIGATSKFILPNADKDGVINITGSLFNRGGLIYDADVSP